MAVETNNGKKGGWLVGKKHRNGGIKAVITDSGKPVELEAGEAIITAKATKKHWKKLSQINQDGGGVPITPPSNVQATQNFKDGGLITTTINGVELKAGDVVLVKTQKGNVNATIDGITDRYVKFTELSDPPKKQSWKMEDFPRKFISLQQGSTQTPTPQVQAPVQPVVTPQAPPPTQPQTKAPAQPQQKYTPPPKPKFDPNLDYVALLEKNFTQTGTTYQKAVNDTELVQSIKKYFDFIAEDIKLPEAKAIKEIEIQA